MVTICLWTDLVTAITFIIMDSLENYVANYTYLIDYINLDTVHFWKFINLQIITNDVLYMQPFYSLN